MKTNIITALFLLLLLALLTKFTMTIYDIRSIGFIVAGFLFLVFFMLFFK